MTTTRVFQSGNSQAVRIPCQFKLDVTEIEIFRRGDELVLRKKKENLLPLLDIFAAMPDDFMEEGRNDPLPKQRELRPMKASCAMDNHSKPWDGFIEGCEGLSEDFDSGGVAK